MNIDGDTVEGHRNVQKWVQVGVRVLSITVSLIYWIILIGMLGDGRYLKKEYRLSVNDGKRKKVFILFGTRPEAVKVAPVIKELQQSEYFKVYAVSTGQHSTMLNETMAALGVTPTYDLNVMTVGQDLDTLTDKLVRSLKPLLRWEKPDLVMVQGDTTTAFVGALEALYHHIPVAHIEAGLRTWNIEAPYPEEFNRQSIGIIADYHFAATEWARENLAREGKPTQRIYVTGNTVVDSLFSVLKSTQPSARVTEILKRAEASCGQNCKNILLTSHRRENLGKPMENIFSAVVEILRTIPESVVVFPMHKNSAVRESLMRVIGEDKFNMIMKNDPITDESWKFLNRLVLSEPFDYLDIVHAMKWSTVILTDSGGIQEEGVSIGKPVFILRTTTERPEAVASGSAVLVGTEKDIIVSQVTSVLQTSDKYEKMARAHHVYGDGTAAKQIRQILENEIIYGKGIGKAPVVRQDTVKCYDLIIVLTVWKRSKLEFQFENVFEQSALKHRSTNVIVFQNGEHQNIENIIEKWTEKFKSIGVTLTFVHSKIETGYHGRFLAPLLVRSCVNASWILCDDDIFVGSQYYDNMLRVVNEGFMCTRNARYLTPVDGGYDEGVPRMGKGKHVTWEDDVTIDFGGHLWAGRVDWLRTIWSYPPIDLTTAEDFWLSAVVYAKLGIETKIPRCPYPVEGVNYNAELCACSIREAKQHQDVLIGDTTGTEAAKGKSRGKIITEISKYLNYTPLYYRDRNKYNQAKTYGKTHKNFLYNRQRVAPCEFWN